MANVAHGQIIDGVLYKRGSAVRKFWKYNGYAIPSLEMARVKAVKLYTKYDGKLFATQETFDKHGIIHLFKDKEGAIEQQIVLPVQYWENVD